MEGEDNACHVTSTSLGPLRFTRTHSTLPGAVVCGGMGVCVGGGGEWACVHMCVVWKCTRKTESAQEKLTYYKTKNAPGIHENAFQQLLKTQHKHTNVYRSILAAEFKFFQYWAIYNCICHSLSPVMSKIAYRTNFQHKCMHVQHNVHTGIASGTCKQMQINIYIHAVLW